MYRLRLICVLGGVSRDYLVTICMDYDGHASQFSNRVGQAVLADITLHILILICTTLLRERGETGNISFIKINKQI